MTLSAFIEAAVETMGGVFMPVEYALCTVLIPDHYKDNFQGRNELLLAFDYEVAQENPESEFVTYGSYIFDTILQIARTSARVTQRYACVDRLELSNTAEKIKSHIDFQTGVLEILSQRQTVGLWALYNFTVIYTADERFEETREIWVNLVNGCIDSHLSANTIFYDTKERFSSLPYLPSISMQEAYEISYKQAETSAVKNEMKTVDDRLLKKELSRIKNYYDELIAENKKRINRKGITEERVNDILQKEQALILEKNKQIHEMEEKHNIKVTISLENAIVYHIPLIQIFCKMNQHRRITEQMFYYDPIMKRIISGSVSQAIEEE